MLVNDIKVEKTLQTKALYLKRAKDLIEKSYKEASKGAEYKKITENTVIYRDIVDNTFIGMSLLNTCIWFKKFWASNLRPATVRQYRASLRFFSEREHENQKVNSEYLAKINQVLDSVKGGDKKTLEDRTSSAKQKHLKEEKLKLIIDDLKDSKSKWSKMTIVWLQAAINTGLRPIEWTDTTYDKEKDCLIVKNAKNTNSRSHGEFRTIYLSHIEAKTKQNIRNHLLISQHHSQQEQWIQYYRGCSSLLQRTCKKLFPRSKKHISLYSGRHQYSANLKASGLKSNEIAALMGHSTDETAMETYGKKSYGSKGLQPDKMEIAEVEKVKVKYKIHTFTLDDQKPSVSPNSNKKGKKSQKK